MTEEEKHKLIELSDLNREDNIKYISSEAQGIAITLDSDKYAPTFCKLERAYICGRRKSEKRIEELEGLLINSKRLSDEIERAQRKQIAELKEENNKLLDVINNQDVKIADLEKKLEKMKCCENCNEWYRLPTGQKDCAETNCEKLSHWTMRIKE